MFKVVKKEIEVAGKKIQDLHKLGTCRVYITVGKAVTKKQC